MNDPAIDTAGRPYAGWETKMFWCVYILDRRYSFMTSLPFALQDRDIDFNILQRVRSTIFLLLLAKD
jgi:hypothetical protein